MRIVYGVPWIEVEFGQRDEGYALYTDLRVCIENTKAASARGACHDGYYGPVRPLHYYEIPFDCLEDVDKASLDNPSTLGTAMTRNNWDPKFKSSPKEIR